MFPNWLGKDTVVEIVGVVDDMLPAAVDGPSQSQIFVAEGRGANIGHVTLVVKTSGDPAAAAPMRSPVACHLRVTDTRTFPSGSPEGGASGRTAARRHRTRTMPQC